MRLLSFVKFACVMTTTFFLIACGGGGGGGPAYNGYLSIGTTKYQCASDTGLQACFKGNCSQCTCLSNCPVDAAGKIVGACLFRVNASGVNVGGVTQEGCTLELAGGIQTAACSRTAGGVWGERLEAVTYPIRRVC
jgi:hypothetical protein